jgi:peptidoglycan/LPS O-acetylase OafA/YrhL
MAASPIARGMGVCILFVLTSGFLWVVIGVADEGIDPWARVRMTALLLAMGGGLLLALWRLEGWGRAFACWAVASLTWTLLMTGLASSGSPAEIGVGGWLLAAVPPLIAGVVMLAYFRINGTYRV